MFVRDVTTGLQLGATDQAFAARPDRKPVAASASSVYGNALTVSPETQSALVASANAA